MNWKEKNKKAKITYEKNNCKREGCKWEYLIAQPYLCISCHANYLRDIGVLK